MRTQLSISSNTPWGNRSGWSVNALHKRIAEAISKGLERPQDLHFARALTTRVLTDAQVPQSASPACDTQTLRAVFDFLSPYRQGPLQNVVLAPNPLAYRGPSADPSRQTLVELPSYPWEGLRYEPDPTLPSNSLTKPETLDLYQTLMRSIEVGSGDCDDHVIALATMLHCVGFQCRANYGQISYTSGEGQTGATWHVWLTAGYPRQGPKEWVGMDTTYPTAQAGWVPPTGRIVQGPIVKPL